MFTPIIKLEHSDARGEIFSITLPGDKELILLHSTKGSLRGGHSHDVDELVALLSGKMLYHKLKRGEYPGQEEVWAEEMFPGQASFNPADVVHMGEFTEDSWVIEQKLAKKGEWENTNYAPWRKRVEGNAASIKSAV